MGLTNAMTAFVLAGIVTALTAAPASAQTQQAEPDYSVRVFGYFDPEMLQEFGQQVQGYVELRDSLQTGLPVLRITIFPQEIERAETLLARRVREARKSARQGDILTSPLKNQIKHMLVLEADAKTLAAIMDDNPGEFSFRLNDTYPKNRPLSTVPANILALLPALESGVEYRFIGRHLILRDSRANMIIDAIPFAIHCHDCVNHDEGE